MITRTLETDILNGDWEVVIVRFLDEAGLPITSATTMVASPQALDRHCQLVAFAHGPWVDGENIDETPTT